MSQSNGATTLTMQQAEVMPTVMPDGNGEAVSQVIFRYVPKSKVAQFTIRGKSPLLTNKIRERSVEEIRVKQDLGTRGKKGKRDKKSDFEQSMHIMPDGSTYGFPASGVKEAMVTAIRQVDFTSMAAGERLFYVLGEPRLIPLRCSRPVMQEDIVYLGQNAKSADLCYRARFDEWEMDVRIRYNAEVISEDQLATLLGIVGESIGLGSWRLENNGWYGAFEVVGAAV